MNQFWGGVSALKDFFFNEKEEKFFINPLRKVQLLQDKN